MENYVSSCIKKPFPKPRDVSFQSIGGDVVVVTIDLGFQVLAHDHAAGAARKSVENSEFAAGQGKRNAADLGFARGEVELEFGDDYIWYR